MKSWLPIAVKELQAGREIILVQETADKVARAGVLDDEGVLLAGERPDLAGPDFLSGLKPQKPKYLNVENGFILADKLSPADADFWQEALTGQQAAWAAWLLTMVTVQDSKIPQDPKDPQVLVTRHILAALGPWTTPRIPEQTAGRWSLLPLNAALGCLLVFGSDDLAFETAALGARAGLKVNLVTAGKKASDIKPFKAIGDFSWQNFGAWSEIQEDNLSQIGLKPGVFVLITALENLSFLASVQKAPCGWLGLAGEAAPGRESGLFPEAVTPAQKALGLLAAMLEK
jgi:hypothetical protein